MTARILDLDGSVTSQVRLLERIGDALDVVDLRKLGPAVRYLPSKRSAEEFDAALRSLEPARLTFTGSGDFHHAATSILKGSREPLSLIVFDQHSDWIGYSPCPCGSWLVDVLRLAHVERIVVIGTDRKSIEGLKIAHGPVREIIGGRVELYPSNCKASRCLGKRKGHPACATLTSGLFWTGFNWRTIAEVDWGSLIRGIIDSLPTPSVHISIDKDCLTAEHAVTNWGNGDLTLGQVVEAVRMLGDRTQIVGADITGEYSPIEVENRLMHKMALKIHPKTPEPSAEGLHRNEDTNLALVEALSF